MFTRGDKDQIKDLVIAWAGHECDAVEDVLIAGESLQLDGSGNATASKWASTSTSTVGATGVFSLSGALNLPADTQRLVSITKGGGDEAMQLWESQYTLTGLVVQLNPDAMDVGWPVREHPVQPRNHDQLRARASSSGRHRPGCGWAAYCRLGRAAWRLDCNGPAARHLLQRDYAGSEQSGAAERSSAAHGAHPWQEGLGPAQQHHRLER